MTREEALELGIYRAMKFLGEFESNVTPERAATNLLECCYGFQAEMGTPDELEGFAVGLQLVAVEVAEIARKRRAAAVATLDEKRPMESELTATAPLVPEAEAFTYERVEVAGPAGDPIWTYQRRPVSMSKTSQVAQPGAPEAATSETPGSPDGPEAA